MDRGRSPDLPPPQRAADDAAAPSDRVPVAVAAVWREGSRGGSRVVEVLVARRHAHAIRGGLWELPGGKIEPGESPESAARREVEEETGIHLPADQPLESLGPIHPVDEAPADAPRRERRVQLHALLAKVPTTMEAKPLGSAECRWVTLEEFDRYEWPPANGPLNEALRSALRSR